MPAAGQIIQVTIRGLQDGQLIENVLHVREMIDGILDEALELSLEALRLTLLNVMGGQYSSLQTMAKRMTPTALDTQFIPLTGAIVGQRGGLPLNSTLAQVCTLRTGASGKTHRGRMYIGAMTTDTVNQNRVTVTYQGFLNTMADSLITQFGPTGTDASIRLGIYSRVIGGSTPFTLAGWQQVSQIVPQPITGNQRRRRAGVGA